MAIIYKKIIIPLFLVSANCFSECLNNDKNADIELSKVKRELISNPYTLAFIDDLEKELKIEMIFFVPTSYSTGQSSIL